MIVFKKLWIMVAFKRSITLILFLFSFFSFSQTNTPAIKPSKDFQKLGGDAASMEVMGSQFDYKSQLNVVQKRILPRKNLSEFSLAVSPVLKGIAYLNIASLDMSYRFYINPYWSLHFQYYYFLNTINAEGKDMYYLFSKNPLELEYPQKKGYLVGVDWNSFYGKVVLANSVTHFDIYLSFKGGFLEILRHNKHVPTVAIEGGLVFWVNQFLNVRTGLAGSYHYYEVKSTLGSQQSIHQFLSKLNLSLGLLF